MKTYDENLVERLCRSLAYHAVETEFTLRSPPRFLPFTEGSAEVLAEFAAKIAEAKALVVEAGFDFDQLYPPEERPTTAEFQ